ncbi:MAG: hypothetical protein HFJ54_03290 [Clostridia bacterium]|nr:hypothetical protein [Clostridia bacterium]
MQKTGGIEFLYNSKVIEYETLSRFIKEEFLKNKLESENLNEEIIELNNKLEKLKLIEKDKEEEYQMRQKQVAMYLECKKSFFGKIKYYFTGKKDKANFKKKREIEEKVKEAEEKLTETYDTKEFYTIEDLIDVTKILDRVINQTRNINQDIKALEMSIDRLSKKIDNARRYIEEIEEHKKSIFEFWNFVNKDNILRIK